MPGWPAANRPVLREAMTRCWRAGSLIRKAWRPQRPRLCENRGMQKYAVVIHEDAEGGFWAEVPALPSCYSQGETITEVMENVREAITGVLEVMKEQGRQPEPNIQILDVAV